MTNAEIAILSLIAESPRHGYEIENVIKARGMRDWTEVGFSSIYYLLKKLEREGYIKARLMKTPGQGPARKVYQITPAGREAWYAASLGALSEPQNCYPLIQLGLANLPGLPEDKAIEALRQYGDRLTERRDYVHSRAEAQHPLPDHVVAMFDYSLSMIEAEREWIRNFIKFLEEKDGKNRL